jgi:LuxR family maltose regulon positive regulatory protein
MSAARGQHREALGELVAAGQVQALMVGEHALSSKVTAWTIAAQARLGDVEQARAALDALDGRQAGSGEIRNAAAVVRLAERDPAGARRELRVILDGSPLYPCLALVEAHLLDALACRDLGDESAERAAVERALHLAEPDRLILPFAMTGAWQLLTTLPTHGTSHAALVADILDAVRRGDPGPAAAPAPAERLSPSELRVLRYLPTNLTRPEIAGQLSVSLNTVNTHIRRIYTKLGATDRSSAVQRGRELRLLSTGRA